MIFESLRISNWRQFREVDITFHPRLTVLTGANGAGKTTVLNTLSRHFGWHSALVSTPRRSESGTVFHPDAWDEDYLLAYEKWLAKRSDEISEPPLPAQTGTEKSIGTLRYGSGQEARLAVPATVGNSFNLDIHGQASQPGMHIPSHRPIYSYQSVENIPTTPRKRDQAFSLYMDLVRNRFYGGHTPRTPNYFMKETLISLAAFGYGNQVIDRNNDSLATFEGFQDVLRVVLPSSLGFQRLAIRLPEVVLITKSGDFSLDAVSGGIASLVDLAWQIFMYSDSTAPFAVTLDEPENHLHPELQRSVLSTLLKAFPHVQFICASHNPFVVTSVPDSQTYALKYGPDNRVKSQHLSAVDRSGSSNEVLRDVLGLPSSSPLWVENVLRQIEDELRDEPLTPDLSEKLRTKLSSAGLERFAPSSLAKLISQKGGDD